MNKMNRQRFLALTGTGIAGALATEKSSPLSTNRRYEV